MKSAGMLPPPTGPPCGPAWSQEILCSWDGVAGSIFHRLRLRTNPGHSVHPKGTTGIRSCVVHSCMRWSLSNPPMAYDSQFILFYSVGNPRACLPAIPSSVDRLCYVFSRCTDRRSTRDPTWRRAHSIYKVSLDLSHYLMPKLIAFNRASWRAPFFLIAGLSFLCAVGGLLLIDPDLPSTEADTRVDWLGAFLVTAGLVLLVFVLGQGSLAPHGWKTGCTSPHSSRVPVYLLPRKRYHRPVNC